MLTLPYRAHSYVRFLSTRTGETLFEIRMISNAIIVWGRHYRPSEFSARLADDGESVTLEGTLHDRCGAVLTFGQETTICAGFTVEVGELPADYDGSWTRDRT